MVDLEQVELLIWCVPHMKFLWTLLGFNAYVNCSFHNHSKPLRGLRLERLRECMTGAGQSADCPSAASVCRYQEVPTPVRDLAQVEEEQEPWRLARGGGGCEQGIAPSLVAPPGLGEHPSAVPSNSRLVHPYGHQRPFGRFGREAVLRSLARSKLQRKFSRVLLLV